MRKVLLFTFCFINYIGFSQLLNDTYVWNDLHVLMPLCKSIECGGKIYNTYSYSLGMDVVLDSNNYRTINATVYDATPYSGVSIYNSIEGYIREDVGSKKIYYIPKYSNEELLLYDFSLTIGNQFIIENTDWFNGEYNVTNVDSIMYLGQKRKTITITKESSYSFNWIEGVGAKQGFLYVNHYIDGALLCLNQDSNLLYQNELEYDCIKSEKTAIDDILTEADLKIFPNPGSNFINIEQIKNIKSIEIFDLYGNIIATYNPNNNFCRVKVTSLKQGIYFIKIDSVIKKLIIE